MTLGDRLRECTTAHRGARVPLRACGERWGYVDPVLVPHLADSGVFRLDAAGLTLDPALRSPDARTSAVSGVLRPLFERGVIGGWRGEAYPVKRRWTDPAVFAVERGAVGALGTPAFGVHVNGFVETAAGPELWVARRCQTKATFPGRLDHLAAGGQPAGLGLLENVVKEAEEEAGIPARIAERAIHVHALRYRLSDEYGYHDDTLHVFDLELPDGFEPWALDGEVEAFERFPIGRLVERLETTRDFKTNVALVVIDWLFRRGLLDAHRERDAVEDYLTGCHST